MQVFLALAALCVVGINGIPAVSESDPVRPKFEYLFNDTVQINGSNPNVTLHCNATGYPQPTYIWYNVTGDDAVELNASQADPRFYSIEGGNLTINMSFVNQTKSIFRCAAKNSVGTVLSNPVTIYLAFLGKFSDEPRNVTNVSIGNYTFLSCNAPGSYPSVEVKWTKKGSDKALNNSVDPYIFVSKNSNLYFSKINSSQNGSYFCKVYSPIGNLSSQKSPAIPLNVTKNSNKDLKTIIPPEFPAAYPARGIVVGINLTLECFAFGNNTPNNPLKYIWSRIDLGGKLVKLPAKAKLSDFNRTIFISNVTIQDGGVYVCNVTRVGSKNVSKSVTVKVNSPPVFNETLKDISKQAGKNVTLRCMANGVPAVKYTWYYNGVELTLETLPDSTRFLFGSDGNGGPNSNILIIIGLQESDAGLYQCEAKNEYGTVMSAAGLTVA